MSLKMLKNAASRLPLSRLLIRLSDTSVVIWRITRSILRRLFLAKEQQRERLLAVPLRAPNPEILVQPLVEIVTGR
jgi:hypothetical protein